MESSHCEPCGKDFSSYKNLWRHKKICKATQRVLCTNCAEIMPSNVYKSHRQNCTSQRVPKGESSREKLYKQLNDSPEREDDMSIEEDEQKEFKKNEDNSLTESVNNEPDSDDQTEDIEDKKMDNKIWNAIATWCRKSETDALDGFKFWFEFCQKLENDPTIQKIMETVHALRDNDESLSFKKALHFALMKRKYLIYETLKAYKTEGIWKTLLEEPDNGLDVFQWLTKYILACRSMKREPIFISVKEMIEDLMEDVDPMDFEEALNHSIEAKADEIFESTGELPSRDTFVWDRIAKTFNPLLPDPYSEVEYFINMQQLIEEDETFQTVLVRINEYLENGETLDVALYKAVKENESLIHESFSRGGELWDAMKADEFGNEKENLDVFKTYVLYHLALNHDELFQSIMDNIESLIQDGWEYRDALKHVIQMKKVDIRNVIGHPFVPGLKYLVNLEPPR